MTQNIDSAEDETLFAKCLGAVETIVSWAAGLALLAVVLTIFFNATGRYLTGWSFLGGEELARLMTVWITFIAAFTMVRSEGHVNIDLLLRSVSPTGQRIFRGISGLFGVVTMVYLCWTSAQLTMFSFNSGQMGTTLPVPRALFFLPVTIGSAIMAVAFLDILLRAIRNRLQPLPALTEEAPDSPGLSSEQVTSRDDS